MRRPPSWLRAPLRRIVGSLIIFSRPRVRVMVIDAQGRVLLVRNWLNPEHWALPGGGRRPGESPAAAASRELREETGVNIEPAQLQPAGQLTSDEFRRPVQVVCFWARATQAAATAPPNFEIVAADWHSVDALPANTSATVLQLLQSSPIGYTQQHEK